MNSKNNKSSTLQKGKETVVASVSKVVSIHRDGSAKTPARQLRSPWVLVSDLANDIVEVSLNRPDKYNGLNIEMIKALAETGRKLRKNRKLRGVILRGEGQGFCSGLDIKSVNKNPAVILQLLFRPPFRNANLVQEVAYTWRHLRVPVIAVCHGVCYGGGLQIALGADFRYSTPDCKFSIMEGKWGLVPDMSGTLALRELVSNDVAKELAMTARIFSAEEALDYGIVSKVSDDPYQQALDFFAELEPLSTNAVAQTKRLFNTTQVTDERETLITESRHQYKLLFWQALRRLRGGK